MLSRMLLTAIICGTCLVPAPPSRSAESEDVVAAVNRLDAAAWNAALQIWEWAEPGYQEEKSSALLADMLTAADFTVQKGVAGIPTAFTATYGSGQPVIGILGEFDALPGLSQTADADRVALDNPINRKVRIIPGITPAMKSRPIDCSVKIA